MADKYKQADRDDMAKSGAAMPDGSYPIKDAEDLANAIHAVGRGNADHNAIRAHIIARAKALGLSSQIPDNWSADGSLKQSNAMSKQCPTCDGTGKIKDGNVVCPDCEGTGEMSDDSETNAARVELERRRKQVEQIKGRKTMERRTIDAGPPELRSADDGKLHVTGYASVFDRPYDVGFYQETIKRGAFTQTLNNGARVQLLLNHGGLPLASTDNGTLKLSQDSIGLRYDAELDPDDPDSASAARKVRSGLLNESSFAFMPVRQDWNDDYTQRSLSEVSIDKGDVSIVNFGASEHTSVSARSREAFATVCVQSAVELIDHETRAGAMLSAATTSKLKNILALAQQSDTAVDHLLVQLSGLLGVTNPDIAQDAEMDKEDANASRDHPDGTPPKPDVEPDPPAAAARALPNYGPSVKASYLALKGRRP